jgi:exopolysaccharide production protein ExoQ
MPDNAQPTHKSKSTVAEEISVVVVLLLSTGAFMNVDFTNSDGNPSVGIRVLWYLSYFVMSGLFWCNRTQGKRRLLAIAPIVAVVAFASMSTFWSQDPALTFRHSIDLACAMVFGAYFASRYELPDQLRLLAWVCGICVVFSFLFGLFGLGTASDADKNVPGWYGIFIQKNNCGRMMLLSTLIFFFWGRTEPSHKRTARIGAIASIVLLLLSRSLTSTIVFVMVTILIPYMWWILRKSTRWMTAGFAFLVVAGATAVLYVGTHLQQTASLVGKDPTLTGRLEIWILCVVMALRQPWLGYGYEAFWLPDQWYVQKAWKALGWNAPSAHNGYLQLWLELGILGTCLFLLVFFYFFVKSLQSVRHNVTQGSAWPLALLLFLLLTNLTEPIFLESSSIFFMLYVSVACWLCQDSRYPGRTV